MRDNTLETQLTKELGTSRRGEVHAFQEISSTMDVAHTLAAQDANEGTLVWALAQTKGRGRLGRVWKSPEGGVYLSLIVRPKRALEEVPQLSLIAGLALAEAVKASTGLLTSLRWPNDLLLNGKKLAGILTESRNGAVVIGLGINVTTEPAQLPDTATSLQVSGAACDSCRLTGALYSRFFAWYDEWTKQGFAAIRPALRPWIGLFGQPVHISAGSQDVEGTAQELDEQGKLVVRLDSGVLRAFEVGEVTLLRQ